MSIPAISNGSITSTSPLRTLKNQMRTDFQSMISDVKSGDLGGAQSALAALQNDNQALKSARGTGGASSTTQTGGAAQPSQLQTDFAKLISDLQSGNMTNAQSDLSALQADAKAKLSGATATSGTSATAAAATSDTTATAQPGNLKTDIDAMLQAIKSGDLAGAQADAAKVTADIKAGNSGGSGGSGEEHHHHHHGQSGFDALTAALDSSSGSSAASSAGTAATSAYAAFMSTTTTTSSTLLASA